MIRTRFLKFGITAVIMITAGMFAGQGRIVSAADSQPAIVGAEKTIYLDGKDIIEINGKHIVSVTYSSSKSNIAVISKKGVVLPKKKGKTKIRATVVYKKKASGKKYTKKLSYRLSVLGKAEEYFKFAEQYSQNPSKAKYKVTSITDKGKQLKKLYVPGYVGQHKVVKILGGSNWKNSNMVSLHLSDVLVKIEGGAISDCKNLERVYIGEKLSSIGGKTFEGCPVLRQIILDDRNDSFCVEDGILFNAKKSILYRYLPQNQDSSYTVPQGVSYIGGGAFADCKNLKQLVLSDSVTKLGDRSFANSGLTAMTLSDNVDSCGAGIFAGCASLSEVQLSKRLWYLSRETFLDCISLTSITLPANIGAYGNSVFEGCTSLSEIEVSDASKYFSSVDGVLFDKEKTKLCYYPLGKKESDYQIPEGTITIGERAFCYCTALQRIEIPASIKVIESYAFYQSKLQEVFLPDSITSMGNYAFAKCEKMSKIKLSNGLSEIPYRAFAECVAITEVTIPREVISVRGSAFEGCSNLVQYLVDDKNTSYTVVDGVLYSKSMQTLQLYPIAKVKESFTVPDSVTKIGAGAFAQAKWLKKIAFSENVTDIEWCAFEGCENLKTVRLPKNLTSISNKSFAECTALTTIKIPASVKKIDSMAFRGCTALTDIKIPNSVTTIGYRAFSECEKLKTVEIGSKVKLIESCAFKNCKQLKKMTVKSKKITAASIQEKVFKNAGAQNGKKLVIVVPSGKKTAYMKYFQAGGLSKKATVK